MLKRPGPALLCASAAMLLYAFTLLLMQVGVVDDAYIFLRYARNIREGAGPVFNPGEAVEGYTSPLWLAVLTALWPLPVARESLASGASIACGAVLLIVLLWRESRGSMMAAMIAAAYLATSVPFAYWSGSGMDTAAFALAFALTVMALEADLRNRDTCWRTGAVLALAALVRLEALWLAPLFAAIVVLRSSTPAAAVRRLATLAAPVIAVQAVHVSWRYAFYGSWLPNTFAAKVGIPRDLLVANGVAYLGRFLSVVLPLLAVLGVLLARTRAWFREPALAIPAAVAVWWSAYVVLVGGDHFPLWRFFVPVLVMLAMLSARIAAVPATGGDRLRPAHALAIVAAGGVLANVLAASSIETPEARAEVARARGWASVGRWCAGLPPGAIASLTVGAIPFYCERTTIDLLGLVDAHVARHGRVHRAGAVGHQKYDTEYVVSRAPRYVIFSISGQFDRPLLDGGSKLDALLPRTNHALIDLVAHPVVREQYDYRAEPLPDGTWVEYLARRRMDGGE